MKKMFFKSNQLFKTFDFLKWFVFGKRQLLFCLFMMLFSLVVLANDYTGYNQTKATAKSTGNGSVYVSYGETEEQSRTYATESSDSHRDPESGEIEFDGEQTYTYYFYAKADQGYTLEKWTTDEKGENSKSTSVPYSEGIECNKQTNKTLNEITRYAVFCKIITIPSTSKNVILSKNGEQNSSVGINVNLYNAKDFSVDVKRTGGTGTADINCAYSEPSDVGGETLKLTISTQDGVVGGDKFKITLKATNGAEESIDVEVHAEVRAVFAKPKDCGDCSYTVTRTDGSGFEFTLSKDSASNKTVTVAGTYKVKANVADGFHFRRWVVKNGNKESYFYGEELEYRLNNGDEFVAEFVPDSYARFIVLDTDTAKYKYAHLEDAIAEAQAQSKSVVAVYVPEQLKITSTTKKNSGLSSILNPYSTTINSITSPTKIDWVLPKPATGKYIIPSGITLLVPGLDKNAIKGLLDNKTERTKYVSYHSINYRYNIGAGVEDDFLETNPTPVCICKLSVESGTEIEVNGAISVYSVLSTTQGYTGRPSGYGQLHLGTNSKIKVNNGGKLHVLGYVTGNDLNATVTASAGATIYESFQFTDWRGGRATLDGFENFKEYKVFPVSQYYMQSIETKLIMEYGAKEVLIAAVDVSSPFPVSPGFMDVINEETTTSGAIKEKNLGLFLLGEGTRLEKYYDFAKDSLYIKIVGNGSTSRAKMNYMYLDVSASGLGAYSLDSRKYVLSVNHNIALTIDNVQMECPYRFAFMPGSRLEVTPTAHLKIQNKVYLYDAELNVRPSDPTIGFSGSGNAALKPITYTSKGKPTARSEEKTRHPQKLKDATFVINGMLTMEDATIVVDDEDVPIQGMLQTTTYSDAVLGVGEEYDKEVIFGANIISTATGVINYNRIGDGVSVYQIKQNNTSIDGFEPIPVCNAWLRNVDKTRTGGTDAEQGDTYMYIDGVWTKPTINLSNPQGAVFEVTLPNKLTQNVVCDVVENNATITKVEVLSVEGEDFSVVGDLEYKDKKVTIPVEYKPNGIHNYEDTPNQGKIKLNLTYLDNKGFIHTTDAEINLIGKENYRPLFSIAINGTPMQDGDTYSSIQGTGVGESTNLSVVITPVEGNVASTNLVTWNEENSATASPFSFVYGEKGNELSGALLSYTPQEVSDNHEGTLTITASYLSGETPIESTITINLSAKVDYKDNNLQFAIFPQLIYTNTESFILLDAESNNANTDIRWELSPVGVVEIVGEGTVESPYKVSPITAGPVTITVTQVASAAIGEKTIEKTINVISEDVLLAVPFCIEEISDFNSHTVGLEGSVTYNESEASIELKSQASAEARWEFRFSGISNSLNFTPSGKNTWRIREKSDINAPWTNVLVWENLAENEPVSLRLKPTTRYVDIASNDGKLKNVCVTALNIQANENKVYIPINPTLGEISERDVVFTHVNSELSNLSVSDGLTIKGTPQTVRKGTDNESYYETTVTIQAGATTAEGEYELRATHGEDESVVSITTYKFPQELPIDLANDAPERYHFVTIGSEYAQWDEEEQQIRFLNPGNELERYVTFAFNGAPSVIKFNLSKEIVDADWKIWESIDGRYFTESSIDKRKSLEGNQLIQELNYTTRYVKVVYKSAQTQEVTLSHLVIEGYPQAIVSPTNLFFRTDALQIPFYMIAVNLQEVNFEIDAADSTFLMTMDTINGGSWCREINANDNTHPTALGQNKVDTIPLLVKWLQKTTLDEGRIIIRSATHNDSVLAEIPLIGSDSYITKEKAENTGIKTGIPNGYTYHKAEYTAYSHHDVHFTNAFDNNGIALFDYLFIYGETTPAEGTDITAPKRGSADGSTNIGSNAVTPLFVYRKVLNANNQYAGYQFVGKLNNVNVPNKSVVGNVIVEDTADVVYIDVQNKNLSVYMTGFCPYATTGYDKLQEGVFLFRGTHGDSLDIYLEDFHVLSRNKTEHGNTFYGEKEGGETYSDSYARGSGGVLVFENVDAQEQLQNYQPFVVSIHSRGDNLLNSNHGCFFALKIGEATAMKATQVSSPIQVHMVTKDHINKTKTTLNFDDIWPTVVDANNLVVDSCRTNGFLALKKQANNAPSIDLGNPYTEVNFKGGRIELQNSQIGSDTYKTTLAISYRAGFFGSEDAGIKLCHGIGTDAVDGVVNFLDGTVTVERMKVAAAYRQYYLMDTLPDGSESEYTSCLRTPRNTFVRGGSICRIRACQNVTSKGGGPRDKSTGSLLGQYVYELQPNDELYDNGLVKSISFPDTIAGLLEYQLSRNYTYGLSSVAPDGAGNLYFWIPNGFGGVTAEKDVFMTTWKACMTKIGAGVPGVAEGTIGGDIRISSEEEVRNFLYCQLDQNIYNVINEGPMVEGKKTYTYKAPIEVPAAAKDFFDGAYTRWSPNLVGEEKEHEVLSDSCYTITNKVYYITTATADIWKTFTAPFDVKNIYVVETFSESELEKKGTRGEIIMEQAKHNADFAAFFGVAMAMGTMKDFDAIYDSYIKWAKIEDDSLGLYTQGSDYSLRGMYPLIPYVVDTLDDESVKGNWASANFYLNHNGGDWILNEDEDFGFTTQWKTLSSADTTDGILLHKGETYSMLFPYCVGCGTSLTDSVRGWDYWSGKFLIFESVNAPQTINGRDFLNDTIFSKEMDGDNVKVTGNSTFAFLETEAKNVYVYETQEPDLGLECFLPIDDKSTIYPTTAFLYGSVPTRNGMPARRISYMGKIDYGGDSGNDDDVTTGGDHVPTINGGSDIFVTSITEGINIAVSEPQAVGVFSATGQLIYSGWVETSVNVNLVVDGVYVVVGENNSVKIIY